MVYYGGFYPLANLRASGLMEAPGARFFEYIKTCFVSRDQEMTRENN